MLIFGLATGGFGYSLGFQQGGADGSNGAAARMDLLSTRLMLSKQAAMEDELQAEEAELPGRHPATGGERASR